MALLLSPKEASPLKEAPPLRVVSLDTVSSSIVDAPDVVKPPVTLTPVEVVCNLVELLCRKSTAPFDVKIAHVSPLALALNLILLSASMNKSPVPVSAMYELEPS